MKSRFCVFLILCAAVSHCGVSGSRKRKTRTVHTTLGDVQGITERVPVKDGHVVTVIQFVGIPFAKPPVGDLRFRPPVPADPWVGVYQATTPPNYCFQALTANRILIPNPAPPVSEDCLTLTMWVPRTERRGAPPRHGEDTGYSTNQNTAKATGLATIVWMNSEVFTVSSYNVSSNGAKLAASQNVIVISVNNRIGPLGYLFLDIPEAPGNVGLQDMTLALQWINNNIENFGGDPERITVAGGSPGGSSAALLLFSPLTQNLFNNIILHSPDPTVRFVHQSRELTLNSSEQFARAMNCYSENKVAMVNCLKQADPDVMVRQFLMLVLQGFVYYQDSLVDGYFLTQEPFQALQSGAFKHTNILTGYTKNEGFFVMNVLWPRDYNFTVNQTPRAITREELNERLLYFLGTVIRPEYIPEISEDIQALYSFDSFQSDSLTLLDDVIGDFSFECPTRLLAASYARAQQNVYLYQFNHVPDITNLAAWTGAFHTAEIPFVFGSGTVAIPEFSAREVSLSDDMMRLWANFAKYGNPTPDFSNGPTWPTYNPPDPGNALVFTESADVQVGQTETRRCAYWNSLPRSYFIF